MKPFTHSLRRPVLGALVGTLVGTLVGPLVGPLVGAAAAAAFLAATPAALAQSWPARPIRLVVTAPAGGTSDLVARVLAEGMGPLLGQTVIVDNKAGGLGAVGTQELLSSPRDGYTFLIAPNGLVSEIPHLAKPRYDPFEDIRPLVELSRSGLVMVGNPALPASTLSEVIAYVKANPGKVSYASYSAGTVSHTMGVELNKAAGVSMTHVGYKGSPPALQDVMGGHVPLMFDGPATSIPMIKAGKLKAFAVSSPKRMAVLPDVPTFTELGFPQIDDIGWIGLWTTPDVPADIQAKVRDAALRTLRQPKVAERFRDLATEVGQPLTPEQLTQSLRVAFEKHGAQLKAIGFKPD